MNKRIFLKILLIFFILIGGMFLGIELVNNVKKVKNEEIVILNQSIKEKEECLINIEGMIIRGNSLFPLVKDGQNVKMFFDYYKCNEITRDDIVLYDYVGNEVPLIKIIKGIPGDKFNLKEVENGWYILINEEILKNSVGIPYLISGKKYKMLALYEKDFKGEIPDNAYLLLGNNPNGTMDSTRFGFINQINIQAKVEY